MNTRKCNKCNVDKKYSEFHKDKSRPQGISYICKLCDRIKFKSWVTKNKEHYKKTVSEWAKNNKNPERSRKNAKLYRLRHKEKIRKDKNEYEKRKMKTDIHYRIKKLARKRINNALKHKRTNERTEKLLGCTIQEYAKYIESLFKVGMSWDNQNLWEIDHIIPCVAFDLNDPEQQKKCFHYSNVQPLWKEDHKIKTHQDILKYSKYHNKNFNT